MKEKSRQALTAQAIRALLKKQHPATKFKVTSSSFAGGDSVRVSWEDGPLYDEVNKLVRPYQYGSFDGMQDIYLYDNYRQDIPQSKYIQCTRNLSETTRKKIVEQISEKYDIEAENDEDCQRVFHA